MRKNLCPIFTCVPFPAKINSSVSSLYSSPLPHNSKTGSQDTKVFSRSWFLFFTLKPHYNSLAWDLVIVGGKKSALKHHNQFCEAKIFLSLSLSIHIYVFVGMCVETEWWVCTWHLFFELSESVEFTRTYDINHKSIFMSIYIYLLQNITWFK